MPTPRPENPEDTAAAQRIVDRCRLAEAAPDLLEALRECITDSNAACYRSGESIDLIRRINAIGEIAIAAIIKATGKAPTTTTPEA